MCFGLALGEVEGGGRFTNTLLYYVTFPPAILCFQALQLLCASVGSDEKDTEQSVAVLFLPLNY